MIAIPRIIEPMMNLGIILLGLLLAWATFSRRSAG